MVDFDRPNIWDFLIWGLVISSIGVFVIVKVASPDAVTNAAEIIRYLIVGVIMGLAAGISNYSLKRTIFAVSGGLIAGTACFLYTYLFAEPYRGLLPAFLTHIVYSFFWYAIAIILSLVAADIRKKEMQWDILLPMTTSIVVIFVFVILNRFMSIFAWVFVSFTNRESVDILMYPVVFAMALLNVTINIRRWCKFCALE